MAQSNRFHSAQSLDIQPAPTSSMDFSYSLWFPARVNTIACSGQHFLDFYFLYQKYGLRINHLLFGWDRRQSFPFGGTPRLLPGVWRECRCIVNLNMELSISWFSTISLIFLFLYHNLASTLSCFYLRHLSLCTGDGLGNIGRPRSHTFFELFREWGRIGPCGL